MLMETILHITRREQWEYAQHAGSYHGDTLDTEGFIHCSTPHQVVRVADARFRGQHGLVLLCVDPARVRPEIRYEPAEDAERFPHIYGPLNTNAVIAVLGFEPDPDGGFALPGGIPAA